MIDDVSQGFFRVYGSKGFIDFKDIYKHCHEDSDKSLFFIRLCFRKGLDLERLTSPGVTRAVLERFGIRARKKYGQNFLTDGNIVRGIVDAAEISSEDCVLEIGPGIGTMTQALSGAAAHVVCVEIDENLRPVLALTLEDCGNVDVIWQDILRTDLRSAGGKRVLRKYHGHGTEGSGRPHLRRSRKQGVRRPVSGSTVLFGTAGCFEGPPGLFSPAACCGERCSPFKGIQRAARSGG